MLTYKQTRDKQFFEYDKILSYIDIKIWKKRKCALHPIRSVLINGMCNFEDGTRAATAASKSSVGLDVKYENAWRFVAQLPRR